MAPIAAGLILLAGLGAFLFTMQKRIRPLLFARKGEGDSRLDDPQERTARLLEFGFGQRRMPSKPEAVAGLAHILVFAAFLVAQVGTMNSFGLAFDAGFVMPLFNAGTGVGRVYLFIKDLVIVGGTTGALIFFYFRIVAKKERLTQSWEGVFILFMIAGVMWSDALIDSAELASQPASDTWYFPLAGRLANGLRSLSPETLHGLVTGGVLLHVLIVVVFLNFLPLGKHFHILTGLPTVFFQRLTPQGVLSKTDLENSEKFGVAKLTDLSWKEVLDTYSCTECGRCQTYCPTYVTGKPLSHKEVNRAVRRHATEVAETMPLPMGFLLQSLLKESGLKEAVNPSSEAGAEAPAGATAQGLQLTAEAYEKLPPLVGEGGILPDETVWACTTCGWCEQACPVFIEQLPRIIDMRRNLVLMESRFPDEAARVFKNMENQGNPWGMGSNKRGEWAEGLGVPTAAELKAEGKDFEYLFFVGCAGSFDERQKKVSKALVEIFKEAKVSYAILGEEETCTGDSARRLGNEYLFQSMAQANVEMFNGYGVKKIITQCPHCFNTIGKEYPQFGGNYKVLHHTEVIAQLVADGKLKPDQIKLEGEVTVHDSCYLARHNGVTEAPRQALISLGIKVKEMDRNRTETFCCGAGGGRMWLEEKLGQRVNQNRVDEAAATLGEGGGTVATSCPFCLTMVKDGINETGRGESMQAKDIAELVAMGLPKR
jgi:Fe-S oxidoreductase